MYANRASCTWLLVVEANCWIACIMYMSAGSGAYSWLACIMYIAVFQYPYYPYSLYLVMSASSRSLLLNSSIMYMSASSGANCWLACIIYMSASSGANCWLACVIFWQWNLNSMRLQTAGSNTTLSVDRFSMVLTAPSGTQNPSTKDMKEQLNAVLCSSPTLHKASGPRRDRELLLKEFIN